MIELRNVSKTFQTADGALQALSDVSLTIRDGDIFGIVGMSGAGKSTLVRCINLLERPTSGQVLIDGLVDAGEGGPVDLCTLTPAQLRQARRSISMIFQQFNLLMQRTCLKNICFPMEIAGVPKDQAKKRALELLETVGLPDKADAYPAQLSGGQKQRIAIARALASNPKVLLCDEATSALDPTTTRSILRLIQDINRRLGLTVVVITHEMAVVEEICNRVAILEHGHMVETGTVEEVFSNPQTEAGRRLVYPEGVQIDHFPVADVVRIAFNGGSSYEPLIASLAIDCGVKVNILGADTRNVGGQAFGTMLLGLPQDKAEAAKAMNYLKAQKDVTVEEVHDYHA
ncbi:methionine ABC transporter ATP-binding protein [uncultured Intestinimonas sp.]|uniref:methionine ABC transporter ATP-binding protein n=1 Tax=uncultured Intestinimonas sp. TaxID=1689265 RepID=UPI0025FFAAA9|nr:ATP-binding cassette domain-containing protein [uncultured Intestinimonas sp.]